MKKSLRMATDFLQEEDGASMAEYLVLLGVLVLAVGGGILAYGGAVEAAFAGWADWIGESTLPPSSGT